MTKFVLITFMFLMGCGSLTSLGRFLVPNPEISRQHEETKRQEVAHESINEATTEAKVKAHEDVYLKKNTRPGFFDNVVAIVYTWEGQALMISLLGFLGTTIGLVVRLAQTWNMPAQLSSVIKGVQSLRDEHLTDDSDTIRDVLSREAKKHGVADSMANRVAKTLGEV